MVRSLTLAALLAAGTIVGLSPSRASAHPPIVYPTRPVGPIIYPPRPAPPVFYPPRPIPPGHGHDHGHKHYSVLIRHRGHWDVHSTHRDREDAIRAARRLEYRGYDARIERIHVR